ncbi:protein spartin [Anthonomus grandis grandis]|uniref:protein spartin n=1 Tax=Anthonomus grandis grandis TaxID=2921223 RepID=UPI0021666056|nr:protein spartin [Anthonomus grandis grandis]
MGNGGSLMWNSTYLSIKTKHDLAYKIIEDAIRLEEQEKPQEAIEKYKDGIKLIDEILRIPVQCPEKPNDTWGKACEMIQKIKRTRAEVLTRINSIQTSPGFQSTSCEPPPSYEEAISSSDESTDPPRVTYKDLATALQELSVDPNQHINEELVYTYPGVRLYFISPNGEVVSTREPHTLRISLVEGSEPNTPRAILQIGDWVYPLVPGVSPCYRTDYGAFILPDVYSNVPGSSVGIILPSDADAEVFDLLESILHGIITQETEQEIFKEKRRRQEKEDASARISNNIINGAWTISQGIIRGAHKAGDFINRKIPTLIEKLSPSDQPTNVPKPVSKGIKIAENATSKAVKVTGFVAEKVGEGTMRLGQFLAPHIQKQGTKLLASGFNMPEREAENKMKSVLTVAAGAVEGFSTIYRGLETSAGILGNSLKDNTVKVVEHKWGPQCANTTEVSLNTVGNMYSTYQNTKILRPKGLMTSTAKNTGISIAQEHSVSKQANQELLNSLDRAGPSFSSGKSLVVQKEKENISEPSESDKENEEETLPRKS